MQKNRFIVAYGLLAVAAILVVLVACGKGMVDFPKDETDAYDDVNGLVDFCKNEGNEQEQICQGRSNNNSRSSSGGGSASSGSEGSSSSSSEEGPSSSSEEGPSSSSEEEEESSSSTGPEFLLKCRGNTSFGTVGVPIEEPTVECSNATPNNVRFTWVPECSNCFKSPKEGTFSISVKAECGGEEQQKPCGEVIISGKSSSSRSSSSGAGLLCMFSTTTVTVGVPISLTGVVTCNGSNVSPSSVSWEGATASWFNDPKPVGTKTNIKAKANCGGSSQTATCADITVLSSSSAGSGGTSSSSGTCTKTGWCVYGEGVCYQMPTDDCCDSGRLFSTESACKGASTQYCNWGACVKGSDWSCESGGCYALNDGDLKAKDCTDKSGTIVSSCPAGTCPPSATYCQK